MNSKQHAGWQQEHGDSRHALEPSAARWVTQFQALAPQLSVNVCLSKCVCKAASSVLGTRQVLGHLHNKKLLVPLPPSPVFAFVEAHCLGKAAERG